MVVAFQRILLLLLYDRYDEEKEKFYRAFNPCTRTCLYTCVRCLCHTSKGK